MPHERKFTLPSFNAEDPELWFDTVDIVLKSNGITDESKKFSCLLEKLETTYVTLIRDLVRSPDSTTGNAYSLARERLIQVLGDSKERKLDKLLTASDIAADQKSSLILKALRERAGSSNCEDILRRIWLKKLPSQIQIILADHVESSLDQLANSADKMYEMIVSTASAVPRTEVFSQPRDELSSILEKLSAEGAALRTDNADIRRLVERQSRSRTRSPDSRSSSRDHLRNRSEHRKPRLYKDSCIWFLLFIIIAILPASSSYPTTDNSADNGSSSLSSIIFDPPRPSFVHPGERTDTPHWFNPCNGTDSSAEKSSPSSEENELLFVNVIRLTCEQAIFQFEQFRQRYIKKTFKSNNQTDFHSHKSYAWLRQNVSLTKGLGEKLSSEHLDSLDSLERTAIIAYGHLQRVAVGFEQVVYDSRMNNSDFQDEFIIAENNLKRILCEVRELIPDEKLRNFENANRNIMVDRLVSSQTHQDIRDWVIFREYMILVEYINQYMTYYLEKKTHQRDNLNH